MTHHHANCPCDQCAEGEYLAGKIAESRNMTHICKDCGTEFEPTQSDQCPECTGSNVVVIGG